ncbi:MAG: hypothetical protein N3A66_08320 [Planctomycetota bacterium]|nr:hypothetical protein [Planctomycetota bacterium]
MRREESGSRIFSALLSTQLLAADVYASFTRQTRDEEEAAFWQKMLFEELGHIRFAAMMLENGKPPPALLPEIRLSAFREIHERAVAIAADAVFDRVLWALRLEHAEIDFGVEALAMDKVGRSVAAPVYPSPLREHYECLLAYAARYRAAKEIAAQMARIEEHLPPRPLPG